MGWKFHNYWRKSCLTLDADNRVLFYEHKKAESVILNGSRQEGIELTLPVMEYTETEYGLHMFMDCPEHDKIPETTLGDNYKSYRMVLDGIESVSTGNVCHM